MANERSERGRREQIQGRPDRGKLCGDRQPRLCSVLNPPAANTGEFTVRAVAEIITLARRDPPRVLLVMAAAYRQEGIEQILPQHIQREEVELHTTRGLSLLVCCLYCPTYARP